MEINSNPYELQTHGRGESYHPTEKPWAVLYPQSTNDVAEIVRHVAAYEGRVPIIPYGAGTSVEGHVCAIHGGLCLDMSRMDNIDMNEEESSVFATDGFVMVGAGVRRVRLNEALRHTGMQFVVDPGADASIGGMIACGASGTTAVKYGTMRQNLVSLECVMADGTIAQCGTSSLKNSAGYDLTSLLTGSEGTLGIITAATVRLHPIPDVVMSAICSFDNVHDAAEAVASIRMCGVPLERCELLDASSVDACNRFVQKSGASSSSSSSSSSLSSLMDVRPTIFLEFTGPTPMAVQEHVDLAQSICMDVLKQNSSNASSSSSVNFKFAKDEADRRVLWAARHNLYYATLALRPGSTGAVVTDTCVPLSQFADVLTETVEDVQRLGVVGLCFGHAGDGNFHCVLPVLEDDSDEYFSKVTEVNENAIRRSIDVGGTCTGEHGVGYGKMKYLEKQYGKGGVAMMRAVKSALDPHNIMNPGKIISL